ncbi:class I SAM-dependent methyltransferase [Paractinoplanes atraurantiacus]|uniref:Methyltransferase domain-containing protein n=1 Tax=Paractinoplanes atraurantiacus TaxID=1036182 RepID=A0A285J5G2_9ACTN|nr:class I SAM-dependent methyltransferase [Actinoplanes atraurantiacus]SNY54596.1 Methyltransferase domain-containing protein [Actinoplanes atraurantiacus]
MTTQDRINDYWTGRAPAYDAYQQRPSRLAADNAAWMSIWAGALPFTEGDVLDVGTGSGHVALTVAALGHRVTGIDLSEGMLAEARRHRSPHPPSFRRGDAVAPDFAPGSFDAVVGRYVMWTLRSPVTAVQNWMRLLRPGGVVAVVDSTWFPEGLDNASESFTGFYDAEVRAELPLAAATSIDQTAAVLREAGLTAVTVTPLTTIYELDQQYGVAPGHEVRTQYLITGRLRSGPSSEPSPWPRRG